jgi:hypothetical protein
MFTFNELLTFHHIFACLDLASHVPADTIYDEGSAFEPLHFMLWSILWVGKVSQAMKALAVSLVAAGILTVSTFGSASNPPATEGSWPMTLGEGTSLVGDVNIVSANPESNGPTVGASEATLGGGMSFGDGAGDDRKVQLPSTVNASGESASLPSVPLPAPVLLAGIGVVGLVLCRNRVGRLVR